jgi:hypothetical protein
MINSLYIFIKQHTLALVISLFYQTHPLTYPIYMIQKKKIYPIYTVYLFVIYVISFLF